MGKRQLEELEKNGMYLSVPRGISMQPMIYNKRGIAEIHRLDEPAKKYDVVLYIRRNAKFPDGQGVLHRVIEVRENDYVIMGDNCWQREYIRHEDTVGILRRFYRRGKWIDTDNKLYLLYSHIWVALIPVRRPVFWCRDMVKRVIRKIYRCAVPKK